MEPMLLSINNYEDISQSIQADSNLKDYHKQSGILMELGSNENMVTNLHDMRDKLNKLVEEGRVKDGEFNYKHLESIMDGAMKIQINPNKSLQDISMFYTSYNNFADVYKKHKGDE